MKRDKLITIVTAHGCLRDNRDKVKIKYLPRSLLRISELTVSVRMIRLQKSNFKNKVKVAIKALPLFKHLAKLRKMLTAEQGLDWHSAQFRI